MNWVRILPGVGSGESSRRIREALRAEKDKRYGEVGRIEADLGFSEGYLAKVCRGAAPIAVDRLLQVLERMEVDPGRFFARALGGRTDNDALLEEVERFGVIDRRLARIEKVTRGLETAAPVGPVPPAIDAGAMVADFVGCSGREQRRRLGAGEKYRHPAFAAAYLEHLDALRYDDAKEARLNAGAIAVKLIPRLPGQPSERIALQLKAIGVYASCHRQKGNWATAARALRLALGVSRRHRLAEMLTDLLRRAACVLSDNGRFWEAMGLLNEALVVCIDTDSHQDLGIVMVERATALLYLGEYRQTIAVLNRSLTFLQGDSLRMNRSRMAAHQVLGLAHKELGELRRAEVALSRAVAAARGAGRLNRASLLWDHGAIALKRKQFETAERSLRAAAGLFEELEDPTRALVALDLTTALLAQEKHLEAVAVAMSMAQFLGAFRGNPMADAAISDLVQKAIHGNLTADAVKWTRDRIEFTQAEDQLNPVR